MPVPVQHPHAGHLRPGPGTLAKCVSAMGNTCVAESSADGKDKGELLFTKAFDDQMITERREAEKIQKLLLLGPGESGQYERCSCSCLCLSDRLGSIQGLRTALFPFFGHIYLVVFAGVILSEIIIKILSRMGSHSTSYANSESARNRRNGLGA